MYFMIWSLLESFTKSVFSQAITSRHWFWTMTISFSRIFFSFSISFFMFCVNRVMLPSRRICFMSKNKNTRPVSLLDSVLSHRLALCNWYYSGFASYFRNNGWVCSRRRGWRARNLWLLWQKTLSRFRRQNVRKNNISVFKYSRFMIWKNLRINSAETLIRFLGSHSFEIIIYSNPFWLEATV